MFEYSAVLGNDLRDVWAGQVLPMIDMLRNSSYFWPAIAATAAIIFLVARQLSK